MFWVRLVEDVILLLVKSDTPEAMLAIVAHRRIFKLHTVIVSHRELIVRPAHAAGGHVTARLPSKPTAVRAIVPLKSEPAPHAIRAGILPVAFSTAHRIQNVFARALSIVELKVRRPHAVTFPEFIKLSEPLVRNAPTAKINLCPPSLPLLLTKLSIEPEEFLVPLVHRAETVLAITAVKEEGAF